MAQLTTVQGPCGEEVPTSAQFSAGKGGKPPDDPGALKGHIWLPKSQEGAGITRLKTLQAMLGTQAPI